MCVHVMYIYYVVVYVVCCTYTLYSGIERTYMYNAEVE